uniref:Uncharacterized protein n=1 Tax=Plectus sambesii TaxID=2011161 RepID=A0A914VIN9_9BILA
MSSSQALQCHIVDFMCNHNRYFVYTVQNVSPNYVSLIRTDELGRQESNSWNPCYDNLKLLFKGPENQARRCPSNKWAEGDRITVRQIILSVRPHEGSDHQQSPPRPSSSVDEQRRPEWHVKRYSRGEPWDNCGPAPCRQLSPQQEDQEGPARKPFMLPAGPVACWLLDPRNFDDNPFASTMPQGSDDSASLNRALSVPWSSVVGVDYRSLSRRKERGVDEESRTPLGSERSVPAWPEEGCVPRKGFRKLRTQQPATRKDKNDASSLLHVSTMWRAKAAAANAERADTAIQAAFRQCVPATQPYG